MIEHIKILSYVLLLLSGVWLIFYINSTYRLFAYKFLKSIRTYYSVVLILLALRFTYFYVRGNLLNFIEPGLSTVFLKILTFSISVVTLLLVYLMLDILISFSDKSFSRSQNIKAFFIGIALTSVYIIVSFFSEQFSQLYTWADILIRNIFIYNIIVNNLEFLLILGFYFIWSHRIQSSERRSLSRLFALFHILCNSISVITLIIFMKVEMSEIAQWAAQLSVMFLFILAPFLWIRLVFLRYAWSMAELMNTRMPFEKVFTRYSISDREKEIIVLIIEGKSNSEIKEKLFISQHTVKNHLSNIYRKLDVKNRYELMHLFMKYEDS
jgi:DNA-binding CsgD family transcriptional regulator